MFLQDIERWRMRQNPILSPRVQVGGRPMPAWFSASMVNQTRSTPPLPPLPTEPPPEEEESEYEEIEHLPRYSNTNANARKPPSGLKRTCDLCGNSNAVVRCEMCFSQIFCSSCNEMYHRHPKRHNHVRKILENLESRPHLPPLPPKVIAQQQQAMQMQLHGPVAPPRRNRRFGFRSGANSPTPAMTMTKKFPFDPMGSLKRFVGSNIMGQRPLPTPPRQPGDLGRPPTPTKFPGTNNSNNNGFLGMDRRYSAPHPPANLKSPPQRSSSITNNAAANGLARASIPLTVLELSNNQRQNRNQSMSVANLNEKHPSRDSGYRGWEEDDDVFSRQHSISTSNLNNFPASNAMPQFSTLQRHARSQGKPPIRPPPPVPPRDFAHQQQRFQSASVFELDRVGGSAFAPWMQQSYLDDFQHHQQQQAFRMGYPGTLHRTPSASSTGGQPAFGWPMSFGPPMSQSEMELELLSRRGSVPRELPCYGNQGLEPIAQTGSLRRSKPQPSRQSLPPRQMKPAQPQQLQQRVESPARFNGPRPPTPSKNPQHQRNVQENEYYSGEYHGPNSKPNLTQEEDDEEDDILEPLTENPEGPWSCEHCTFVNPKSVRVCTICCKTPTQGYRLCPLNNVSTTRKLPPESKPQQQRHYNNDFVDEEDVEELAPVVKAKLSFSKGQKIRHSVEQVRNKLPPTSAWSTASSSFDNNDSPSDSEEEEITQIRQPPPNKNRSKHSSRPGQKPDVDGIAQSRPESTTRPRATSSPKQRVSTAIGSSPSKSWTESGVGDSVVLNAEYRVADQNGSHVPNHQTSFTPLNNSTAKIGQSISSGSGGIMSPLPPHFNSVTEAEKSSKGTSPPPQTISTQTYEELPGLKRQLSASKTSIQSGISGEVSPPPPKNIEMSEKALRYARRAQQQTKLKRSLSTHLTSSENWEDVHHHEGRHLYRSSSRHSLASDTRSLPISGPPSRDVSPPARGHFQDDLRRYPPPSWDRFPSPADYFASVEDLVGRKRRESIRSQEFELSRLLKEAEEFNYTPEDLQVALKMCGERNPVKWLQENWSSMVETVQTLGTKYGREKGSECNEVGTISSSEAKEALRIHRGNVWAAVTECVEQRRKKFLELQSRGTFLREDILTALTANHGNLDAAYVELSKAQLKPFLMRIWGPPNGLDNNEAYPRSPSIVSVASSSGKPLISASSAFANVVACEEVKAEETKKEKVVHVIIPESTASPATTHSTTSPVNPPQVKSDEEENFADAISELDTNEEARPPAVSPNVEIPGRKSSLTASISDPEMEEEIVEAHISHFIQNFEIREAEPIPINVIRESNQIPVAASKSDDLAKEKEDASGHPEQKNKISNDIRDELIRTPCMTENNMEEGIGNSEIASLTQAVNAISLQLQSFIKQQEPSLPLSKIPKAVAPNSGNVILPSNEQISQSSKTSEDRIPETQQNPDNSKARNGTSETKVLHSSLDSIELKRELLKGDVHDGADMRDLVEQSELTPKDQRSGAGLYEAVEVKYNSTTASGLATQVKTAPKKIYEAIGNFAGSLLNAAAASKGDRGNSTSPTPTSSTLATPTSTATTISKSNRDVKEEICERLDSPGNGTKGRGIIDSQVEADQDKKPEVTLTQNPAEASSFSPIPHPSSISHSEANVDKFQLNSVHNGEDSGGSEIGDDNDNSNASSSMENISSGEILKDSNSEEEEAENGSEEVEEDLDGESSIDSAGESGSAGESVSDGVSDNEDLEEEELGQSENEDDVMDDEIYEEINPTANVNVQAQPPERKTESPKSVKSPKVNPRESEIKRLMSSGKVSSCETAEIALKLMDMNFEEEDSLYAAKECSSLYSALSFLQQECLLCSAKHSAKQMVSMLRCTHWCCRTCAAGYFMVQLRDHTILEAVCPFCKEPSSLGEDPELATDYFSNLDVLLKELLDSKHHEMFHRKLRDWTLAKTPNFKWCSKCSSGFIVDPSQSQVHLVCPDCSAVTCGICLEPWDKENHTHRDRGNSIFFPSRDSIMTSNQSIIDFLNENCIECPRCHLKFTLSRGGCMHLTCSQCSFEFCSGCSAPFRIGTKCSRNLAFCAKLGLHAHHPRNCLFYLRDKEPETLAKLLEEKEIAYFKECPGVEDVINTEGAVVKKTRKCQVPIQKEIEDGLQDDLCGQEVLKGYSTVCQAHYVEYLGLLIWHNKLDPISILSNDDLETIIKRDDKRVPGKVYGTKDADYRPLLLKVIEKEIPLQV